MADDNDFLVLDDYELTPKHLIVSESPLDVSNIDADHPYTWMSTMPFFELGASGQDGIRGLGLSIEDVGGIYDQFKRRNDYPFFNGSNLGSVPDLETSTVAYCGDRSYRTRTYFKQHEGSQAASPLINETGVSTWNFVFDEIGNTMGLVGTFTIDGNPALEGDLATIGSFTENGTAISATSIETIDGNFGSETFAFSEDTIDYSDEVVINDVQTVVDEWFTKSDTFKDSTGSNVTILFSGDDEIHDHEVQFGLALASVASVVNPAGVTTTASPAYHEGFVGRRVRQQIFGDYTFTLDPNGIFNDRGVQSPRFGSYANNDLVAVDNNSSPLNEGFNQTELTNAVPAADKWRDGFGVFGDTNGDSRSKWRTIEASSTNLSLLRNTSVAGKYGAIRIQSNDGNIYRANIVGYLDFTQTNVAFTTTITMNADLEGIYEYTVSDTLDVKQIFYEQVEIFEGGMWIPVDLAALGLTEFTVATSSHCEGLWRESYKLRDGSLWGFEPLQPTGDDTRYRTKTTTHSYNLLPSTHPFTSESRPCHIGGTADFDEVYVDSYAANGLYEGGEFTTCNYTVDGSSVYAGNVSISGTVVTDTSTVRREEFDNSATATGYVSFDIWKVGTPDTAGDTVDEGPGQPVSYDTMSAAFEGSYARPFASIANGESRHFIGFVLREA